MTEHNPYGAPKQERAELQFQGESLDFRESRSARNSGPTGLGGWLILLAVTMMLHLLFLLLQTAGLVALTRVGVVTPLAPASFAALAALEVLAIVSFFVKSRWYPATYMVFMASVPLTLMLLNLTGAISLDGLSMMGSLVRSIAYAIIWSSYLLTSQRVHNTFRGRA